MSCEITTGYVKSCDSVGGVATLYAFPVKDSNGISTIDTLTYANGTITALTLVAGKYAFSYNVEIETATFNDKGVGARNTASYGREQSATNILHGNTASMIVEIEALNTGRHALIHKLNDDTYEVLFLENGAKVSDDRTPGTAYEDMNGNTLTWTGKEKRKAMKISSNIVIALLESGS